MLLAAITAALEGWRVTFLGGDLPAADIARAATDTDANAVALSIAYETDDDLLTSELRELRRALPRQVSILVGGRAAHSYRDTLRAVGAAELGDLPSLRAVLSVLANSPPGAPVNP